MRTSLKCIILFPIYVILLSSPVRNNAQSLTDSKVYFNNGDIRTGVIDLELIAYDIINIIDEKGTRLKLFPESVSHITIGNQEYYIESLEINDKSYFIILLESGFIQLYKTIAENKSLYFIRTEEKKDFKRVNAKNPKLFFETYLETEISKPKQFTTEKSIRKFVSGYNNKINPENSSAFQLPIPGIKRRFSFNITTEGSFRNANYQYPVTHKTSYNRNLGLGIGLDLSYRFTKNFTIHFDPTVYFGSHTSTDTVHYEIVRIAFPEAFYYDYIIQQRYTDIFLPISVSYRFNNHRQPVMVKFSVGYNRLLKFVEEEGIGDPTEIFFPFTTLEPNIITFNYTEANFNFPSDHLGISVATEFKLNEQFSVQPYIKFVKLRYNGELIKEGFDTSYFLRSNFISLGLSLRLI